MCGLWFSQGVRTSVAEESPLLPTTGTTFCLQSLGGLRFLTPKVAFEAAQSSSGCLCSFG